MPAGGRNYSPGELSFYDSASQLLLSLPLKRQQGLYYCSNTTFLPDSDVTHPSALRMTAVNTEVDSPRPPRHYPPGQPTTRGRQLLSELRCVLVTAMRDNWTISHTTPTVPLCLLHLIHFFLLMLRNRAASNANPLDTLLIKSNSLGYVSSWILASYEHLPRIIVILVRVSIGLWSVSKDSPPI